MTDQTQASADAAAETTQQADVTLEDVYKSAEAELQQAAPHQQQPAQQQPAAQPVVQAAPNVPDPYDVDAHKAYLAELAKGQMQTQDALRQLTGFLSEQHRKEAQAALDADVKSAVDTVNSVVGHPKPKVIEAMLDAKAREDSRFKALFDNRAKNPAAWSNALKAVAKEFAGDLSVKPDPTLQAAQRARRIAQSQSATTDAPQSELEKWESMTVDEQQREMNRLLNMGVS